MRSCLPVLCWCARWHALVSLHLMRSCLPVLCWCARWHALVSLHAALDANVPRLHSPSASWLHSSALTIRARSPSFFIPGFTGRMEDLYAQLRGLPLARGVDEVLVRLCRAAPRRASHPRLRRASRADSRRAGGAPAAFDRRARRARAPQGLRRAVQHGPRARRGAAGHAAVIACAVACAVVLYGSGRPAGRRSAAACTPSPSRIIARSAV
jgi:hypothetical protein